MINPISQCRICGSPHLEPILSLGEMAMTGIFPQSVQQAVTVGPIELVKCVEDGSGSTCGLLQLAHDFDLHEMYGVNYGYRTGLNPSMVRHIQGLVGEILERIPLGTGDLVVDIGSNDSTLLSSYPQGPDRVGIDPTGIKFARYYPDAIQLIPQFFSAATFRQEFGARKARVITAVAMFYDLPAPLEFMQEVRSCLTDDGLWVVEMSYMPWMLERCAYDTVCHEHLEYYGLRQFDWMARRADFKILDVSCNAANGGSLRITLTPAGNPVSGSQQAMTGLLERERVQGLDGLEPYRHFARQVQQHREALRAFVHDVNRDNKLLLGYGASTKGNVLLQYCGFTRQEIPVIAEVNEDKFGALTPGTHIPIVPEQEAKAMQPDYFMVFPWHFRDFIVEREALFIKKGGRLVMPLPSIEVIAAS